MELTEWQGIHQMAHDIITVGFSLHTLNHKKRQRTKQKVLHQTKLGVFLQVLILHVLSSSCDLSFVEISCCCTGAFLYSVTHAYLCLLIKMCLHV